MWRAFKVILVSVCAVAGVYIWTALTLHVQLDDSTADAHFKPPPSQHLNQHPSPSVSLRNAVASRNISKPISSDTFRELELPRKSRVESATQLYIFLTEGNETTVRWNPVDVCEDWKTIRHTNLPGTVSLPKQNDSSRKNVIIRNRVQYDSAARNVDVNVHSRLMSNCDGFKSPLKARTTFIPLLEHYLFSAYYDDRLAVKPVSSERNRRTDAEEGRSQSTSEKRLPPKTPVIRILAILKRLSTSSSPVKHPADPSGMFCYIPVDSTTPPSEAAVHGYGESFRNASLVHWLEKHTVKVPIELYEMCENHGKQYGGWMLMCSVPASLGLRRPCSVYVSSSESSSLLRKRRKTTTTGEQSIVRLDVFHTDPKLGGPLQKRISEKPLKNFALCVPPLFGRINIRTFAQFVELSSLLGADHVVMYVRDPIPSVLQSLVRHYEKAGVLTVVGWNVPVSDTDIWYNGQLVAINDCLYRSMHAFSHVAFNDLDEFIVPRGASSNWNNMLDDINNSYYYTTSKHNPIETNLQSSISAANNAHCGFSFKSAFFEPMTSSDEDDVTSTGGPAVTYEIESAMRTRMFSAVRTKVMVVPRAVFELGIHHVSRLMEGGGGGLEDSWGCNVSRGVAEVTPTVAYVHHYRQCVKHFDATMDCEDACQDDTMSQYLPTMRRNVRRTLRNISSL